jgi:diaminobutyrate-2-oxoglutarate transaminase
MAIEHSIHDLHFDDAPNVSTPIPGPNSEAILDRQRGIDSSAISYPKQIPIGLAEGKGATVKDVDGNTFLDFFAGIGVLNVGHSNPYVLEGAQEQMEDLVQTLDFPTEARLDLIEKLNEIAPGDLTDNCRVVFGGPTGSNAIEATIKLARYNTGNQNMIGFRGGYHGSTFGAMSVSANNERQADYDPVVPAAVHAPYPDTSAEGVSEAEAVDRSIENVRQIIEDPYSGLPDPAGVWVEAIQGEGGVNVPPEGFLPRLRELTNEHDIPLIIDEIQTGMGRTGEWFACEWDGVTPDAMPVAKAVGGIGLPLSATVYHEDLDTWEAGGHVGTFRGNAPAMVAGTRAIEYIQRNDLLDHANDVGGYMRDRLREVADDVPHLVDVRGRGLFTGAEFVDEDGNPNKAFVKEVQKRCYNEGVLVWKAGRHNEVLRLIPPLVMTHEQAETGLDIITDAIRQTADS